MQLTLDLDSAARAAQEPTRHPSPTEIRLAGLTAAKAAAKALDPKTKEGRKAARHARSMAYWAKSRFLAKVHMYGCIEGEQGLPRRRFYSRAAVQEAYMTGRRDGAEARADGEVRTDFGILNHDEQGE